jgi:O-antigen/teichoic acid export membrane protein
MQEKAVRGIPWTMLSFGATKTASVLTTLVLARLLAPGDFGLFALATLGTGLLSIFNGNWLGATLIVRGDLDDRARGTVLTLLIASGALLGGVLAAAAPLAADIFDAPRLAGILYVFSGILLFSGVNWFYEMVMQRELEFRRRFVVQIARTLAFSIVALALGFNGAGVWSLVFAHCAWHVTNGVALISLAPYRIRPAFDRARVRELVGGSRGFLGQEVAEFVQQNADYMVIGHALGASQLGLYSMAYRQAELPHFAIADPVGTVTFPAFARMRQMGADIRRPFLTALRMVCLLTCPLGVILSAGAVPFTAALLGPKWSGMTGALAVLGLWAIARPLQVTIGRLLNSLGSAWLYGRISTIGLLPFAAATFVAARQAGIEGVAWVLLVYMVIIAILLVRVVSQHAGIPVRDQWRVLRPLLLAGAVSWVVTRVTADALSGAQPVLAFGLTVAACLATYAAGVRLADPEVTRMAAFQLRRLTSRSRPAVVSS